MTSRDEAIGTIASAVYDWTNQTDVINAERDRWYSKGDQHGTFAEMCGDFAIAVYDALRAAGVIPAEGTVTIDRGRWERVSTVAVRAKTADRAERVASLIMDVAVRTRLSIKAYGKRIEMGEACDDLLDGDLDAIPGALTGEETP